jgi:WD40 repeat protein
MKRPNNNKKRPAKASNEAVPVLKVKKGASLDLAWPGLNLRCPANQEGPGFATAFSPDRQRRATASWDNAVILWEAGRKSFSARAWPASNPSGSASRPR